MNKPIYWKALFALVVLGSAVLTYLKDVSIPGRLKNLPQISHSVYYIPAGTVLTCPKDNSPVLFTPNGVDGILDPLKFIPLKENMVLIQRAEVPCGVVKAKCYHTANGWRGGKRCHTKKSKWFRPDGFLRHVECKTESFQPGDLRPNIRCVITESER